MRICLLDLGSGKDMDASRPSTAALGAGRSSVPERHAARLGLGPTDLYDCGFDPDRGGGISSEVQGASLLIDAEALHRRIGSDPLLVLLDVRWALGDEDGHRRYLEGHIPTAVYVDLETEL